ncbi:MAG: peptidylprolyl isomerase [Frankia sp.]
MTTSQARRKKELARQRAQRAAEREALRRRRKRRIITTVSGVLVVVLAGTGAAFLLAGSGGSKKPAKATAAAAVKKGTTTKVGTCVYTATGEVPSKPVSMPKPAATVTKTPVTAVITTNYGTMTATLDGVNAPCTVHAFETLTAAKFFDNTTCHRQTAQNIYVLQCGDPTGTSNGGPAFGYPTENTKSAKYDRGVIAMANTGAANTNGSQFFIVYKNPNADGVKALGTNYTVLGKVTKGLDVLDKITAKGITGGSVDGAPASKPKILSFTITPQST